MKKFIIDFFIFLIPIFLILVFSAIYYSIIEKKVKSKIKHIATFENLIMGDSQMQRINPKTFSNRTFNFASRAEHYYFTYQKIKMLLDVDNHKIEQIILGVSVTHFSPIYNKLFDTKYIEGKASLSRYLYFIPIFNNDFIHYYDYLSKNMFESIYKEPDWGGYMFSELDKPDSKIINKAFDMHFSKKKDEKLFSLEQKKYLYLIDSICRYNKIDLVFVSLPYHNLYLNKVEPQYFAYLKDIVIGRLSKNYINYLDDNIDPVLLSDANHLNRIGADIYSKKINDTLNSFINHKN